MKRFVAFCLILCALPAFAADQFPLRLKVLGDTVRSEQSKDLWQSPCTAGGMGAPCTRDADIPGVTWQVFAVTGRITQRGRTVEYDLVCRSAFKKEPCTALKYGSYSARWRGKKLEVLIETGKSRVARYEVRGQRDVNID